MIYVTAHHDGTAHDAPLPVRERTLGACAGHLVCLNDWALLLEMSMERSYPGIARSLDVYPWGCGSRTLCGAVNEYFPDPSSIFLDPSWSPGAEMFAEAHGYSVQSAHGLSRSSRPFSSGRLRRIDDLRRHFYDLKRETRIAMPATVSTQSGVNAYGIRAAGGTYTYNDITSATCTVDLSARIPEPVRTAQGYSATPRWVLGQFYVVGKNITTYRTVWLPIGAAGGVDMSGAKASACQAVFGEVIGAHTDGFDEYVQFNFFTDSRGRNVAVYDFKLPGDEIFSGWSFNPNEV